MVILDHGAFDHQKTGLLVYNRMPLHAHNSTNDTCRVYRRYFLTVYFDELITRLQSSGLGCNIGDNYFGALSYADDLTLLSPSVNALTKMITICEIFATEYSVMFNARKTAGIQFGQQKELCEIQLNDQVINGRTSVKHLGNVVDNSLSDKSDSRSKRAAFIGSAKIVPNASYGKHTVLPFTVM